MRHDRRATACAASTAPPLAGVLVPRGRDLRVASGARRTFSSTVEPTIYLLAFGFGFGSLVVARRRPGLRRVRRHRDGGDRGAVLVGLPGDVRHVRQYQFQRTYDAILAAPVDAEELVTGEALWISTRAGVYGCVPLLVAIAFGLDPALGHAARPGRSRS